MHAHTICALIVTGVFLSPTVAFADLPYPEEWPKVVNEPNAKCHSVAGRYEYYGETAKRPTPFPTINIDNSGFNRMSIRGRPKTALIANAPDSGEISVTIEGTELSPPERSTFSRQVKCVDGWLSYVREAPGARYEQRYALAEDGSLIVRSFGLRDNKPAIGQGDTLRGEWLYRFRKVKDAQ